MSWAPVPEGSDFPIENLPFGVVQLPDGRVTVVVRIGDSVLDLAAAGIEAELCRQPTINALMASRKGAEVRRRAGEFLSGPGHPQLLHPIESVRCRMPLAVGDFVDFYSSIHHATNVGRLFRPGGEALAPNWRQLPVGYHGRAGSVVVSGRPVTRPCGLVAGGRTADGPEGERGAGAGLRPTAALDFELEVGFVVGAGGSRIEPDEADRHVFGVVLLNDWSARDVQALEYVPLGPHLGKSFATTVSPWVVTLDALAPFLVPPPVQTPAVDPYLSAARPWGLDLTLEASVNGGRLCRTGFASMYWTFAQQLAHLTVNGASVRPGDLFGSGTVSGPGAGELGSLLEMTGNGGRDVLLGDGSVRRWLADGDTVTLTGWAGGAGGVARIGFGECSGRIEPAVGRDDRAQRGEPVGAGVGVGPGVGPGSEERSD